MKNKEVENRLKVLEEKVRQLENATEKKFIPDVKKVFEKSGKGKKG